MTETTEHAVVIAGGGPAGMMLAAELALAKVDVVVVERRPDHELAGSRAGGIHSRTIEVLDQRGVADRFLAEGQTVQVVTFGTTTLDISDFPTRHPYTLGDLAEPDRADHGRLGRRAAGAQSATGARSTGFAQDDAGVDVRLSDGEPLRARYLVGCDGGRSLIRKAAGIEFPGWEATSSNLIAEVEMTEEPPLGHPPRRATASTAWADSSTDRTGRTLRGRGAGRRDTARAHGVGEPTLGDLQRGADRRLRDRLRGPQPDLDLAVHRHDPAGGALPRGTRAAGRRRGPRALPGRVGRVSASACRTR